MRKLAMMCADFIQHIKNTFFEMLFFPLPVKSKRIVFLNFNGRGYGCNPKYICDALLKDDEEFDLIWLVSTLNYYTPIEVRKVKYNSVKALYNLATANVIITNTKNDLRIIKKKNQKVVQTWHASYSPKCLEKAAKLNKQYKKESIHNSKQTDYFLSNSKIQSKEYIDNFWCECEILEVGYPRNDILFSDNHELINSIKVSLEIKDNEKILLYAPTFRDDYKTTSYLTNLKEIKMKLDKTGDQWKILIRLHPNAEKYAHIYKYDSDFVNVTKYPDMQELLMISDILITDYSSSMFDFSIMKKTVYIYAKDIEEYMTLRGLKPMFYQLPFQVYTNETELINALSDYLEVEMKYRIDNFLIEYGNFDDGHASERVCKLIKSKMIYKRN